MQLGLANGDNPNGSVTFSDSLIVGQHTATVDCEHKAELTGSVKVGMLTVPGFATVMQPPYSYPGSSFTKFGLAACRGKQTIVERVKFKNYNTRACDLGDMPRVISLHEDSPDLIMKHTFNDLSLDNVNEANLLYLEDPSPDWVSIKYCGDFECTAPENILFEFQGEIKQRNNVAFTLPASPFSVISNNKAVIDSTCTLNSGWNAYTCTSTDWGLLEFESLDEDKYDRSVQPVYVTSEDLPAFENKLNSFMDHATDSFYVD